MKIHDELKVDGKAEEITTYRERKKDNRMGEIRMLRRA
jgi:hypothetical protein